MSEVLEGVAKSFFNQQVPLAWAYPTGFLSLKPLSSWIDDLAVRVDFLNKWIDTGKPDAFWFSGFFFPQAFVTGCLQNYARKYSVAIDRLAFEYKIIDDIKPEEIEEGPEDGVYVYGLFIEGAKWDVRKRALSSPLPKELFSTFPIIWLSPVQDRIADPEGIYTCPCYKVTSRTGTLSTTGHSTNFIMFLEVPSKEPEDVWILGGVALFLSLSY